MIHCGFFRICLQEKEERVNGKTKKGKMTKRILVLAAAVGMDGADFGVYARTVPGEKETSMAALQE